MSATEHLTATEHLIVLRDNLRAKAFRVTGPHPGCPSPDWDYLALRLPGGLRRYAHVRPDENGYWQALVYEDGPRSGPRSRARLMRVASVDGSDWPGDEV